MTICVYLTHPAVACLNFSEAQRRRLESLLPGVRIVHTTSEGAFLDSLADARVAIAYRFDQSWLDRAPRLEWIATPSAGRDYFQMAGRPGLVLDFGSFHGQLIAETVLGLLLGHCRGLFVAARLRDEDHWPSGAVSASMRALRGSRITILGFGAIGRWIGRLAKPFGTSITGISRHRGAPPNYFGAGDEVLAIDDLDGALARTDYLVLALPATTSTDRILDARRIRLLPEGAAIVNVGRGNAIDEEALAAALHTGALGGAYLDVYAQEPLPDGSPLRSAPNTVLLPHVSACAPQYLDLFLEEFAGRFWRRYPDGPVPS